jgi:hypothetical protein
MRLSRGWIFAALLIAPGLAQAQQPPAQPKGKIVQDVWETAYLDGIRVGYTHLTVEEFTRADGQKIMRAARDLNLTVRRGKDQARLQALSGTDETADGTVVGVFMKQLLGTQVTQELRGVVKDNQLQVTAVGESSFKAGLQWNPKVVGTFGEQNLLKVKKPKPGDHFEYLIYEPIVNAIVTVRVKAEAMENVIIGSAQQNLLRLTARADKIANVQLPAEILWVDQNFDVRRSRTAMPGMGYLVVERSTQANATQSLDTNRLPDLMERQSIKVSPRLMFPHDQSRIVYRITMPDEDDPATTMSQDARQKVTNVQGKTFDLAVTAVRQPPSVAPVAIADPGKEFTESNFFITSDDPNVKQHALAAVPSGVADPWDKARLIEKWVHNNMKVQNFQNGLDPASNVAKTLTGDCTEYAMLTAAMCRAVGVPSRTAIGLVYVDAQPQPLLVFHMWTEVFVRGQWVAIDATLGRGFVGPAHMKITDASWYQTRSMTPLLPVMRVMMGRASVAVVEAR